ncbi:MAG: glycosyltransferase [Chlorobi bacterium]|nr:glycosyltransferase [Chlorobiota bacterium]MCI0716893.1 glycosyltransferase [Chlorobiota bacterium]
MPKKINDITVLMAAYNCAEYIGHSIKSILNQTYKEFEFIIIDDGSMDNTEEIVSGFKDSRIIYKKTNNKGTSAALNYGLKLASGEWIARIDADDLNIPSRLEMQTNFLNGNPEYDFVSSWSVYFKSPSKILFLLREPITHSQIYKYLNLHNPLNQSGIMYRKKIIKKEGYNESFRNNEDFELFYRIRDKVRFYNIPEFLVYTRVRPESKSNLNENSNVYEMLFNPAFKNLIEAKSKGEHFYWASTLAWINFFYGNRKDARGYLKKSGSLKNWVAYLATFLPDKYFYKLIDLRLRYRLQNIFRSKKYYKNELRILLTSK